MIKLENTITPSSEQWRALIIGARNPMNSWDRSDSGGCTEHYDCIACHAFDPTSGQCNKHILTPFVIGPNDHSLMMKLRNAGTDHRKFMRMITVYVDITAPLYWWKEFDTYKVGTVANSCSTMHKIHAKEFTMEDFSHDRLIDGIAFAKNPNGIDEKSKVATNPLNVMKGVIDSLNCLRLAYLEYKDGCDGIYAKDLWYNMIQLLPSSYNQKRTVMLNYEVLANMYKSRKNHKLDEWHVLCDWIEGLPYSELIVGDGKHNPLAHPESYLDDTMAIVDDMTMAQRRELLKYLEEKIEGNKKPIMKKEWEVKENAT